MAQQKGRLLLLKRGDGGSPETFATVCGFRARSMKLGNNEVDLTVADCADPGALVKQKTGYGIQTLEFSGDGLFDSADGHKDFATDALNQATGNYQIVVPGLGTFEGAIWIGDYEASGETQGDMAFSATLRLNAWTFTAE